MPVITIGKLDAFEGNDLGDLCDATETAILAGGGFGWLRPPPRDVLERYWRGVVLVPERMLFVGAAGRSDRRVGPACAAAAQQRGASLSP